MIEGGCYCGTIRYEVSEDPINVSLCHCRDCQKSSGAPAVAWMMVPEDALKITAGELKKRDGANGAERYFCPECGSGIAYKNAQMLPGIVDIQSVTFDDPDSYPPEVKIQMADQIGWHAQVDKLPGFEHYPPQD